MNDVFESNIILNKADRNFPADVSNFSVVKHEIKQHLKNNDVFCWYIVVESTRKISVFPRDWNIVILILKILKNTSLNNAS